MNLRSLNTTTKNMTTENVLQQCTVDGNIVKLPGVQLDRKTYLEVKKKLELIGGKWKSGKTQGFVFPQDPTEYLEQIANGETRNLKKEYQFFATPYELADYLVSKARIEKHHSVLEPSAGQGAIVKAINRDWSHKIVHCYELMDINLSFLQKIETVRIMDSDFLECDDTGTYDRIIANPPFAKNQDIEHIVKMYDRLSLGGRLVSIASTHWQFCDNKVERTFREFLETLNAEVEPVSEGAFKESGTMVKTVIITIDK
jgi:hypothetical protein